MKSTLVSLQYASFQGIVGKIQRDLHQQGYNANIEIHSLSIQEVTPTTAHHNGTATLDAELLIADRFHCHIHLDSVIATHRVTNNHYTGLEITIVDAESNSTDTTDDVDIQRHCSFGSSETLDGNHTDIVEAVLDAIAEIDGI